MARLGKKASRERCSVLQDCYKKKKKIELECVSNLASVEYGALQSFAMINKVFKIQRKICL